MGRRTVTQSKKYQTLLAKHAAIFRMNANFGVAYRMSPRQCEIEANLISELAMAMDKAQDRIDYLENVITSRGNHETKETADQ